MKLYRYAFATTFATFLLLVVGGTVNPTGSALACPDWPLCYGQFFPKMVNGVQYEHTHRIVAGIVSLMTIGLAIWIRRERKEDRGLFTLGLTAVALVIAQAVLGGITVILKLPLLASTGHLALSMFFFSYMIYLTWRLRPVEAHAKTEIAFPLGRAWSGLAAIAVYLQIVLGAAVRHTGSGRACGTDWLLCQGQLFPYWAPGILNMLHRLVGLLVLGIVIAAAAVTYRETKARGKFGLAKMAAAMPFAVIVQIVLGILTIKTSINVPIVTAHLAVGAILLASWVEIHLELRRPLPVFERKLELVVG